MSTATAPPPVAPQAAPVQPSAPAPVSTPESKPAPYKSLQEAASAHQEMQRTGKAPERKPEPVQEKPKEQAQPQPKQPEAKKQTVLDSIKPKDAKVEPKQESTVIEADQDQKSQSRWMQLKAAEEKLKELEPQYLTLQEKAAKAEQLEKIHGEMEKELSEYRRQRDFEDVTKSEKYLKDVEQPWQAIRSKAHEVAEYAGVDERALMKAMQEPNSLLREEKITALLEEGKKAIKPGNIAQLVERGDQLLAIFDAADKYQQEASLHKEQHENAKKAEKLKAETESREVLNRAHEEISSILKTKAHDVLTDAILENARKMAQEVQSDDPMDRAFRSQAEFIVPFLIEENRALKAKLEGQTEEQKQEQIAKPGIRPDSSKPNGKAAPYGSLQEAYQAHKEQRGVA